MKKIPLMMILCASAVGLARAEDLAKRLITTSGTAVVHVVPDTMTLTFESEVRDLDLNKAIQTQAAKTDGLLAALRAEKVEEINSARLSVTPVYERVENGWRETAKISHYCVSQTITCKTKQVNRVPAITVAAIKAGATAMQSPVPSTSELRKHRDAARVNALIAAREKAQAMASTLGAKLGTVQVITEGVVGGYRGYSATNTYQNFSVGAVSEETGESYVPGSIPVSAEVTVAFELQ